MVATVDERVKFESQMQQSSNCSGNCSRVSEQIAPNNFGGLQTPRTYTPWMDLQWSMVDGSPMVDGRSISLHARMYPSTST